MGGLVFIITRYGTAWQGEARHGLARHGLARRGGAWRGKAWRGFMLKKMKTISVKVEGITPLLMNRFRDKSIDTKGKKRTGAMIDEDITDKLYLDEKGKPQIPGIYFRNSFVEAAKQFKITGKGKSTYSRLAGSTLQIREEYTPIVGDYVSFRVAAVNPMTRGRMMVTRPRFDRWSTSFHVQLLDDSLPMSVLNEIAQQAGVYVGVGDWRPEKKGMFGKFMLTSFTEED